ncbi:1-acyl-sn-glycerol-3-phosphate acyltransferase [Catenulispora sp. GP43]|uniref:1-acyl-sn-glycerol-3-phosphate acyltransferase n=1 Tax=Catenulispora sp. GP43 TaxID=3156263 RepID=UPI003516BCB3
MTGAARGFGRRTAGVLLVLVVAVVVLPIALLCAVFTALTSPLHLRVGRVRRVVAVAAVYSVTEIVGLARAAWQRVRFVLDRDDVRDRRSRVRSLTASLSALRAAARRYGRLQVKLARPTTHDPDSASHGPGTLTLPAGPLIVCGRHGGVGGAFLLAQILLADFGRLPRVVLKQTLAWDPLIDTLLSRIPHAFIDPQPGDQGATAARIGVLAEGMDADDALLIFPEGGNFTPRRRIRAIHRLRRRGLAKAASHAEQLRHVLPPHPDGLFSALDAAPDADVVFVAHTGLEHVQSAADMWRALPLRLPVVFTWWTVPAAEIPREEEARVRWLEENWSRIDGWVAASRGTGSLTAS